VTDRGLADLGADRMRGIESGRGRLGHVGNPHAEQGAPRGPVHVPQFDAVKYDTATGDAAAIAYMPHRREPDRGFARPGLADQAKHFAAPQYQVHAIDQRARLAMELRLDAQRLHLQQVAGGVVCR